MLSRTADFLTRRGRSGILFARYADVRSSRLRDGSGVFQIEQPLTRYHKLKANKVILTDPIYFPYFPNAAEWRYAPLCPSRLSHTSERDIDLLVVGTSRGAENVSERSRQIVEAALNNFGGAPEVLEWPQSVRTFLSGVYREEIDPSSSTSASNRRIVVELQSRLNLLRGLRRETIVRELSSISGGKKIVVVGNLGQVLKERGNSAKASDTRVLGFQNWRTISALAQRAKFFLCTHPAMPNTQNERFRVALTAGSVPLVEPYVVYDQYAQACNQLTSYDYGEHPLAETFERCLASESQLRESVGNFATRLRESELDSYEAWVVDTMARALRLQG